MQKSRWSTATVPLDLVVCGSCLAAQESLKQGQEGRQWVLLAPIPRSLGILVVGTLAAVVWEQPSLPCLRHVPDHRLCAAGWLLLLHHLTDICELSHRPPGDTECPFTHVPGPICRPRVVAVEEDLTGPYSTQRFSLSCESRRI